MRSFNGNGRFTLTDGAIHGINIPATLRRAKTLGLSKQAGEAVKTDFAELKVDWQQVFRDMSKGPERLRNLPQEWREAGNVLTMKAHETQGGSER